MDRDELLALKGKIICIRYPGYDREGVYEPDNDGYIGLFEGIDIDGYAIATDLRGRVRGVLWSDITYAHEPGGCTECRKPQPVVDIGDLIIRRRMTLGGA